MWFRIQAENQEPIKLTVKILLAFYQLLLKVRRRVIEHPVAVGVLVGEGLDGAEFELGCNKS